MFTKEERNLIYSQMMARKYQFEEDMAYWSQRKDGKDEVARCMKAIHSIDEIMKKLLGYGVDK